MSLTLETGSRKMSCRIFLINLAIRAMVTNCREQLLLTFDGKHESRVATICSSVLLKLEVSMPSARYNTRLCALCTKHQPKFIPPIISPVPPRR
jgi:hypothetical protein